MSLDVIPTALLTNSNVSLISYEGNGFDEKAFQSKEGYEQVSNSPVRSNIGIAPSLLPSTWNASLPVEGNSNEKKEHLSLQLISILFNTRESVRLNRLARDEK
jgi:hypothetical protein